MVPSDLDPLGSDAALDDAAAATVGVPDECDDGTGDVSIAFPAPGTIHKA